MSFGASTAYAAVVCATPAIAVPQNIDGVYINLVTGATGTTGSGTTGWDFNPYASSSSTLLSFNAATGAGYLSSGGVISALASGATIDGSGTYLTGIQTSATAMGTYRAGVTSATYLGFRLTEGGNTYYGWIGLTTTGPNGFPATLNNYCYENTPNTAITAGSTPVSLQRFSVD
ncbi:hypothetical protein [Tahibacter caeni]|uniref:hypothetical protein n=1 Tax=Tahibacter caeni TaxID=1453545 RepID=UPI0021477F59|nr:hypothetical protein [Tahibacter caeni]